MHYNEDTIIVLTFTSEKSETQKRKQFPTTTLTSRWRSRGMLYTGPQMTSRTWGSQTLNTLTK